MKQAIEFSHQQHPFLTVGPRRKSMTSYMMFVTQGTALIRLGKNEHLIPEGHGFWVPFDCLHALTVLPGSKIARIDISARVTTPLCTEAGFFTTSELLKAVIGVLDGTPESEQEWDGAFGRLLAVAKDQLAKIKVDSKSICPNLSKHYQSSLQLALQGKKVTDNAAAKAINANLHTNLAELEMTLLMREAVKLARSGRKPEMIANELKLNINVLEAMAQPILGKPLSQLNG
ncbi:hypothetical protein A3K86_22035 [Photobacterium jeanii]|uniref:AraC-type arabinose-binding/dimerisation domain-containing protein n=1 Tax=Photobacterium jeanii TaxID=858640 RepID=A0A178K2R8_9GAMM|nr:hypothetical protein [Photobacterium jeanii]OAN11600.1 hypothetical protein A3K86_22035 [Photobacterium jeanii]PST91121.1 hypothetical protein C9I91_11140 [Photobacterium jeanii]